MTATASPASYSAEVLERLPADTAAGAAVQKALVPAEETADNALRITD